MELNKLSVNVKGSCQNNVKNNIKYYVKERPGQEEFLVLFSDG